MAALNSSDTVRSSTLRKAMGISQTLMSKHVSVLDSSGYIVVNKVVAGRNVITELEPTGKGRAAFADHLKHMREIVDSPLEDKV